MSVDREGLERAVINALHDAITAGGGVTQLARAALAVAEPVVREDEREACAVEAETSDLPWSSPTQEQDEAACMMADRIAMFIRARKEPA